MVALGIASDRSQFDFRHDANTQFLQLHVALFVLCVYMGTFAKKVVSVTPVVMSVDS